MYEQEKDYTYLRQTVTSKLGVIQRALNAGMRSDGCISSSLSKHGSLRDRLDDGRKTGRPNIILSLNLFSHLKSLPRFYIGIAWKLPKNIRE
jgi:rRNA pseudouridine-1189 N-methylase Emg1 (Nep1/Mra1 family)